MAVLQLSIAASASLLTLTLGLWAGVVIGRREQVEFPAIFWSLLAYALVTMISVAFSIDPVANLRDPKEVLSWSRPLSIG